MCLLSVCLQSRLTAGVVCVGGGEAVVVRTLATMLFVRGEAVGCARGMAVCEYDAPCILSGPPAATALLPSETTMHGFQAATAFSVLHRPLCQRLLLARSTLQRITLPPRAPIIPARASNFLRCATRSQEPARAQEILRRTAEQHHDDGSDGTKEMTHPVYSTYISSLWLCQEEHKFTAEPHQGGSGVSAQSYVDRTLAAFTFAPGNYILLTPKNLIHTTQLEL